MKTIKMLTILAMGLVVCLPKVAEAVPMGTAWTYQGRLMDANEPADSIYDFQFKLFDDANTVTGNQLGSTIDINDLDVIDGYFTVELDFGSEVFNGDARWLEIDVRPGDSNDPNMYTVLMPRTKLTPVPYALHTRGIFVDNSGKVGIGTTSPEAKLSIQMPRGFMGKPSTVGGLVIKHALLNSGNQLEVQDPAGNTRFVVDNAGNVGIGTMSPSAKLDVSGDIRSTGSIYGTVDNADKLDGQHGPYYRNWNNLTNVPPGFADGIDNVGVGDITAVNAGTGLSGGGTSGDVTLNIGVPVSLSGSSSEPIIRGDNAGTGVGILGLGSTAGVYGLSGGKGVHGLGVEYGVYGESLAPTTTAAVYGTNPFPLNNNYGLLASSDYGVYGQHTDFPVPYVNYAYLGGSDYALYAHSEIPGSKAGYFHGSVTIRGTLRLRHGATNDLVMSLGAGLDYAEGFDVSDKAEIQPGSVLVIDADNPGKLTLGKKAYDSKVAGIVAGAKGQGSGVRLGAGQFDQDVALAGRVYCNVDATETAVEPGDLLTTSGKPGYAMKAVDYMRAQGAILGKAMEKLEKGKKGQILVLVTLQ